MESPGEMTMPMKLTRAAVEAEPGLALDASLSGPVVVTEDGTPKNVVLPNGEYERLVARDRRIVRLEDWTHDEIAALEASGMEPALAALDAELG
jgi:hypothetical protein